jgi:hypothetical protein
VSETTFPVPAKPPLGCLAIYFPSKMLELNGIAACFTRAVQ